MQCRCRVQLRGLFVLPASIFVHPQPSFFDLFASVNKTCTKFLEPVFLEPEDWFLQGQGIGKLTWRPAPAAADIVVEQLGRACHKRPTSLHLIVAPSLITGKWRRHKMTRESDFYFKISAGACSLWGANPVQTCTNLCLTFKGSELLREVERSRLLFGFGSTLVQFAAS
jgi:hypothetical protein